MENAVWRMALMAGLDRADSETRVEQICVLTEDFVSRTAWEAATLMVASTAGWWNAMQDQEHQELMQRNWTLLADQLEQIWSVVGDETAEKIKNLLRATVESVKSVLAETIPTANFRGLLPEESLLEVLAEIEAERDARVDELTRQEEEQALAGQD